MKEKWTSADYFETGLSTLGFIVFSPLLIPLGIIIGIGWIAKQFGAPKPDPEDDDWGGW